MCFARHEETDRACVYCTSQKKDKNLPSTDSNTFAHSSKAKHTVYHTMHAPSFILISSVSEPE